MDVAYDGRQVVGMDLHRRRSVLVRMTMDGRRLETARIENSPAALRGVLARCGQRPLVVLEATYGWYWAADVLEQAGRRWAGAAGPGRRPRACLPCASVAPGRRARCRVCFRQVAEAGLPGGFLPAGDAVGHPEVSPWPASMRFATGCSASGEPPPTAGTARSGRAPQASRSTRPGRQRVLGFPPDPFGPADFDWLRRLARSIRRHQRSSESPHTR